MLLEGGLRGQRTGGSGIKQSSASSAQSAAQHCTANPECALHTWGPCGHSRRGPCRRPAIGRHPAVRLAVAARGPAIAAGGSAIARARLRGRAAGRRAVAGRRSGQRPGRGRQAATCPCALRPRRVAPEAGVPEGVVVRAALADPVACGGAAGARRRARHFDVQPADGRLCQSPSAARRSPGPAAKAACASR